MTCEGCLLPKYLVFSSSDPNSLHLTFESKFLDLKSFDLVFEEKGKKEIGWKWTLCTSLIFPVTFPFPRIQKMLLPLMMVMMIMMAWWMVSSYSRREMRERALRGNLSSNFSFPNFPFEHCRNCTFYLRPTLFPCNLILFFNNWPPTHQNIQIIRQLPPPLSYVPFHTFPLRQIILWIFFACTHIFPQKSLPVSSGV